MKLQISVNGREIQAEPDDTADGTSDIVAVEPGVYSVLRNGRAYLVRMAPADDSYTAEIAGRRFNVEVRDPRNSSRRSNAALGGGRQSVTASMPGKVVRLLVSEGQEVTAGQGLIVVEAMKMQNEMKAAKPGQVAQVHAREGATVKAGEVLLVIE